MPVMSRPGRDGAVIMMQPVYLIPAEPLLGHEHLRDLIRRQDFHEFLIAFPAHLVFLYNGGKISVSCL